MRLGRTGCAIPRIGCRRKTAALDRIAFRSVLSASAQFRWPSEIRWGCALQFTVHKATMPSRRSRLLWIGRIEAPRCARQSTDSRLYHRLFKRGSQGHAFAPHRLAGAGGGGDRSGRRPLWWAAFRRPTKVGPYRSRSIRPTIPYIIALIERSAARIALHQLIAVEGIAPDAVSESCACARGI